MLSQKAQQQLSYWLGAKNLDLRRIYSMRDGDALA